MPDPDYQPQKKAALARLSRLRGKAVFPELREIIELARKNDDVQLVVDGLAQQIRSANRLDLFEPQLAALAELRGLYGSDPRYDFARDRILWYHKWVIEPLAEHADIPRESIEEMTGQFEEILRGCNIGLRPVHMLRCRSAWMMGRMEEARGHYERWQESPPGRSDDCEACELNGRIEFLIADNRYDEVIPLAEPLFKGKLHCDEVPLITYGRLLAIALKSGKARLAEAMYQSTRRAVRKKRDMLASLGRQVFFLAITGRAQEARRMAALALGRAPAAYDYNQFVVYVSCAFWFAALTREGIGAVKLPLAFAPAAAERNVLTPAGAAWCLDRARALAVRFDARNGNAFFSERVADMEHMIRAYCQNEAE